MSLLVNGTFPPLQANTSSNVSAEERINAIDYVNRVNLLFEEYNIDKLVDTFTPDGVAYHFHGVINGIEERRKFFENTYPYLIPGVSRHATNHIVDRDDETGGVIVRYHMQLIRHTWPGKESGDFEKKAGVEVKTEGTLPQIWLFTKMIDRLVLTKEGYKIHQRYLGSSAVNPKFDPPAGFV